MTLPEKNNDNVHSNMDMSSQKHEGMDEHNAMNTQHGMRSLPLIKQIIIISITFPVLAVAILATLYFLPMVLRQ